MKNTKKILLYSPYLHILGGGERHILSIIQVFDKAGYETEIVNDDENILEKVEKRFGMVLHNAKIIQNFFLGTSAFRTYIKTTEYDYLFYVTDGSYFFSGAKKNIVFAMYPLRELFKMGFLNRLKLFNFNAISNGEFTAEHIDKWLGRYPTVIHPYVDDDFFQLATKKKTKTILSVGRFFDHLHAKRQDVLISAFKKLRQTDSQFKQYKLILAGGYDKDNESSLKKLQEMAEGDKNIVFLKNPSYEKLLGYYSDAEYYWHAAGFGVNQEEEPHRVEHLGITPLEAMASGSVVFCHKSGGPEILFENNRNAFLYKSIDDLVKYTIRAKNDHDKIDEMRKNAESFVKEKFSYEVFDERVKDYFKLYI